MSDVHLIPEMITPALQVRPGLQDRPGLQVPPGLVPPGLQVPPGLGQTVPPNVQMLSTGPHSPRLIIRCRVGTTVITLFVDTGKTLAVVFTSSSSGVLFIPSQWTRKTVPIQSTRRSICDTTTSKETTPDMTVGVTELGNRGCHALVATPSGTSFEMESPFQSPLHSYEELWQPLNMIKKKKKKEKHRNYLTSCFRSEKKVIKYKIIDLTSITSTDSEMFSSQYPTNIEMSETNLQEEKPKNFINRIQRFFRRMKTYFRH